VGEKGHGGVQRDVGEIGDNGLIDIFVAEISEFGIRRSQIVFAGIKIRNDDLLIIVVLL
jgi:hypothetical protein